MIDIGIFAHNEAEGIGAFLEALAKQDLFDQEGVRVLVLANGCRDDTVVRAKAVLADLPPDVAARIEVLDLPEAGKSRTIHRFIHDLSRPRATLLGFMDADITLTDPAILRLMVATLDARPALSVLTSEPVKDTATGGGASGGLVARLITAGGGGLTDWRKSICGQLFMMRSAAARRIGLPVGLPVDDGFMRAMVLTDLLTAPERLERIDGIDGIFHLYPSIRTLRELIHHQTRIVVGSAVNAALFAHLRRETDTEAEAHALLMTAASEEDWLARTLRAELPRAPFGYVPFSFMTRRLGQARRKGIKSVRAALMLGLGLGFDVLIWFLASLRMARGSISGFW